MASMQRWNIDKANDWYSQQPWLVGCNFIPSTAINQLEMFQADTFDPPTLERELGWAERTGFNIVRIYLHDLLWDADAEGLKQRLDTYLTIAYRHGIRTLFCIFDDCWNAEPALGKQPASKPGTHNSGWMQSPGKAVVNDPSQWGRLERYVTGLIKTFGQDERVIFWDLYNEPGNVGQDTASLPLLQKAFEWARSAHPSQPLSAGLWFDNAELNAFQLEASDVITFHNYNEAANLEAQIAQLKQHGRPLICTEWMRRPISTVAANLSIFHREGVGCINWGLVSGKTQTIYPWGSPGGEPEPAVWFHDLYRADGSSFDAAEIALFQKLTGRGG
jgi:hypothetical protein